MVHHPLTLSIAELQSKLETVTLPITLVCAGNRRKEQNMVRKGLGFNVRSLFLAKHRVSG